ncbi:MAG: hypothetical protein RDV41_15755, partial [Planctomycetota bacterium]|nr:hypothetical protein [Planctomycetota bacterium]
RFSEEDATPAAASVPYYKLDSLSRPFRVSKRMLRLFPGPSRQIAPAVGRCECHEHFLLHFVPTDSPIRRGADVFYRHLPPVLVRTEADSQLASR